MANVDRNLRKCFTFNWKVENANYYYDKRFKDILLSPEFKMDEIGDTNWEFLIKYNDKVKMVAIVMIRIPEKEGPDKIEIDYELSLFVDGKLLKSLMKTERTFNRSKGYDYNFIGSINDFCVDLSACRDNLILRCRVWKSGDDFSSDVHCVARTCIGVQERAFVWKVGTFSALNPREKHSYQIKSVSTHADLVILDLFLTHDEKIRFAVTRNDQRICLSSFLLSLVDASGNTLMCLKEEFKFDASDDRKEFEQFFERAKLMKKDDVYLSGDIISLRCECTFSFGIVQHEIVKVYDERLFSECSETDNLLLEKLNVLSSLKLDLIDNLKSMMNNSCHSDIKLRTSTKTYPAHKCILSARSPVFQAMFANEMKENINNCVEIEDLNDDIVLRMLQYIYSADVEKLEWSSATELYKAADKYEVLSLRNICSSFLKRNLHQSNACEALVLADLHQDEELKGFVQNFILRHGEDIINSEGWQIMMESHLKLAAETMRLKFKRNS